MSLKAFHVVFITAAVALAVWLGLWALGEGRHTGDGGMTTLGVVSLAAAAGLVAYEVWFLRKTREVSPW
jgi:hypothetical protein